MSIGIYLFFTNLWYLALVVYLFHRKTFMWGHLVASAIYQWDSRSSIGEIIGLQFIQFWFTIFIYLGFLSEDIHLSRIQSNSEICLGCGCLGSVDADIDVVLMEEGVKSCLSVCSIIFRLDFSLFLFLCPLYFQRFKFWWFLVGDNGEFWFDCLTSFPLVDKSYIECVLWCIWLQENPNNSWFLLQTNPMLLSPFQVFSMFIIPK